MLNGVELLLDYIKPSKLMCYVLIGYWSTPEEDLMRVMHLWDEYKIHSFVMPYDKFNKYQKDFARWCNNKIIFKTRSWEEYCDGYAHNKGDYEKYLRKFNKKNNPNQRVII